MRCQTFGENRKAGPFPENFPIFQEETRAVFPPFSEVLHHDTNETGQTTAVVFSDQDSNETLKMDTPEAIDLLCIGTSTTTWQISGFVASVTAPAFAD